MKSIREQVLCPIDYTTEKYPTNILAIEYSELNCDASIVPPPSPSLDYSDETGSSANTIDRTI